jgi:hypothetical protein
MGALRGGATLSANLSPGGSQYTSIRPSHDDLGHAYAGDAAAITGCHPRLLGCVIAEVGQESLACGAADHWFLEGSTTPTSAIPLMLFLFACDDINDGDGRLPDDQASGPWQGPHELVASRAAGQTDQLGGVPCTR